MEMREVGLEPTRSEEPEILSLMRIPVPPLAPIVIWFQDLSGVVLLECPSV